MELSVTLHEPVPEQAPLHPVNIWPVFGVAARPMTVPAPPVMEQVAPQLMPAGELVTVPVPLPAKLTDSVN